MNRINSLLALGAAMLLSACSDIPMNPKDRILDDNALAALSPQELTSHQNALIEQLVGSAPVARRKEAREHFMKAIASGAQIEAHDPAIAGVIGEINAVTRIRRDTELMRQSASFARSGREPEEKLIRVTVAMTRQLDANDKVRAIVIRSPSDGGVPLLLLREDATPDDLRQGLRTSARQYERLGEVAKKTSQVRISNIERKSATSPALLAELKRGLASSQTSSDVRGFGRLTTTQLATPVRDKRK